MGDGTMPSVTQRWSTATAHSARRPRGSRMNQGTRRAEASTHRGRSGAALLRDRRPGHGYWFWPSSAADLPVALLRNS